MNLFKNIGKKAEGWSTAFDNKYPVAWSQSKDSPCGAIYMAGIRSNKATESENVTGEQAGDNAEEGNDIEKVPEPEEPLRLSKEQHFNAQEFDATNIFLGIYDGNGLGRASLHVKDHLFNELLRLVHQNDNHMSEDIIKGAFSYVENTFMENVKNVYKNDKTRIEDGSCCIASIIWGRTLYIANLGDSRAVLGSKVGFEQLTNDHSVSNETIREELEAWNPNDFGSVLYSMEIWNQSNIKVNRSIGYAHFKNHEINSLGSLPENEQRTQVLVSAEPELHSRKIKKGDRFLILASHGFWNFMTNKNAANIVNRNSRDGIAKRLLSAALKEATKKRGANGVYDDMIIIVLFFREELSQREDTPKAAALHEGRSYLSNIIMASGTSNQSHQSPTSSIQNPPATHTQREGPSIGKVWDICLRSSEFVSDIHQSGKSDLETQRVLNTATQTVQHQPPPPMSAIKVLEMIGKTLKLTTGMLTVEMKMSIFGNLFKQYISGEEMIQVAKQGILKETCMLFYVRYLHEEIISPQKLSNKFTFLNPKLISTFLRSTGGQLENEKEAIATVFLASRTYKDNLILAPFYSGSRWVLIVIDVNVETIYYYTDSVDSETTDPKLVRNFQILFDKYQEMGGVPKSNQINWIKPKCPKQPNDKDSGYYVMKFMKDIITRKPNEIPENYLPDTYSIDDLNEVKTDWASYLIKSIDQTTESSKTL